MDDDKELQEIRRRKLESMQQEQVQDDVQAQVDEQHDQQRQSVLRQILSPEARERMARLKIARAEFAEAVENQLIMLAQSGKLQAPLQGERCLVM